MTQPSAARAGGGPALYPLSFAPIFQYRPWGGRRLADWLGTALPGEEPVGEAWMLSDRDDMPSRVSHGPLKGRTLSRLIGDDPDGLLGVLARRSPRFPLLIKCLDVAGLLSVQVHPPDSRADLIPAGETGKTEAWFVLEADPGSRIYAGVRPGTTGADLRSLSTATVDARLDGFRPVAGQTVQIDAGVVHAIGEGLLVLEVQENSDVTFRVFDWDRIDPATGRPRRLHIEQALACVDLGHGPVRPLPPPAPGSTPRVGERLLDCPHFRAWRHRHATPFDVGAAGEPRIIVCVEGAGGLEHDGLSWPIARGGLVLLPAAVGVSRFSPAGEVTLIEIAAGTAAAPA